METSKKQPATLRNLFSESGRVAKSQQRVLVRLALLFVVPLSLATALYSALIKPQNDPTTSLSKLDVLLSIGHYLVGLVFSVFATSSITFTAFNAFHDEPVKLKEAVKSISASFSRLLATTVLIHAILFIVGLLVGLVVGLVMVALLLSGFAPQVVTTKYFVALLTVPTVATVLYLELNYFILASTVVVVESKSGLEALRQSKALIKGKRWWAFTLLMVLEIYNTIFALNNGGGLSLTALISRSFARGTNNNNNFSYSSSLLMMVALVLVDTCRAAIGQLFILVATTVLYAYCKESQRSEEYSSLLVNEEKVDTVV